MWKRAVCIDGCYKVTNNTPDLQLLWQSLNAKMNSNYKMYSNYETILQCKATIIRARHVPSGAEKQPEQQGQRHQTRQSVHQRHQHPASSHWGSHASQPGPESWKPLLILAHPRSPKRWLALAACKFASLLGKQLPCGDLVPAWKTTDMS